MGIAVGVGVGMDVGIALGSGRCVQVGGGVGVAPVVGVGLGVGTKVEVGAEVVGWDGVLVSRSVQPRTINKKMVKSSPKVLTSVPADPSPKTT